MANRHARFGGADNGGTHGHSQALLLPVRDTPGVFRQLTFDYSPGPHWNFNYARSSFDRIVMYRVDARVDYSIPEEPSGRSGNGRHLRIYPEPVDTMVPDRAVAWSGGPNAYDFDPARRQPLATLTRMVAIAHGNGRDWWVIGLGGQSSPRALAVFLLAGGELRLQHQYINALPFTPGFWNYAYLRMQLSASAQGDRLAVHATPESISVPTVYDPNPIQFDSLGIGLWDFDRCTGEISGRQFIRPNYQPSGVYGTRDGQPADAIRYGNGVDFSPSGRWLYYDEATYIARFDLQAADIEASEQRVVVPTENHLDCFGTGMPSGYFSFLPFKILPNGTLVMYPGGGCRNIGAAFNTDAEDPREIYGGGVAIETPCSNGNTFMGPNLNLHDAPNSPCDTLGINGWAPNCTAFRPPPDTLYRCIGSADPPLVWRGQTLDTAGRYVYRVQEARGCDSLWIVDVIGVEPFGPVEVRVAASPGDSIGGQVIRQDTTFSTTYLRIPSGCDSTVQYVVNVDPSATGERVPVGVLVAYPNPLGAGSTLSVELPAGSLTPEVRLEVIDVLGRTRYAVRGEQVAAQSITLATGTLRLAIEVNTWPPGSYLIRYVTAGREWRTWVVRQ